MFNTEINSANQSKWHGLLIAIIFIVFFSVLFIFETKVWELWPVWDIKSQNIKDLFDKYYIYSWILVSILTIILFSILNLFTKLISNFKVYFQLLLLSISLLPWYFFANQLVFYENRYADYAKAIISYIWYPLLATIKDFILILIILIILVQILLFLKIILWKILKKK